MQSQKTSTTRYIYKNKHRSIQLPTTPTCKEVPFIAAPVMGTFVAVIGTLVPVTVRALAPGAVVMEACLAATAMLSCAYPSATPTYIPTYTARPTSVKTRILQLNWNAIDSTSRPNMPHITPWVRGEVNGGD